MVKGVGKGKSSTSSTSKESNSTEHGFDALDLDGELESLDVLMHGNKSELIKFANFAGEKRPRDKSPSSADSSDSDDITTRIPYDNRSGNLPKDIRNVQAPNMIMTNKSVKRSLEKSGRRYIFWRRW